MLKFLLRPPYRILCVYMIVFMLLMGLSQSLLVLISGPLLKVILSSQAEFSLKDLSGLKFLPELILRREWLVVAVPVALAVIGILRVLSSAIFQRKQAEFSITLASDLRSRLFARVLEKPYLAIKAKAPAQWMSTIINDVFVLQSQISQLITAFLKDGVLYFAALLAIIFLSPWVGLGVCLLTPVMVFVLGRYGRKIRDHATKWQDHLREMSQSIFELRERFWFFKAMRSEETEKKLFARQNREYYKSIRASILVRSLMSPLTEYVGFLLLIAILYAVVSGAVKSSDVQVVQVFAAFALLIRPLKSIGEQVSQLGIVMGAMIQVQDILQKPALSQESSALPPGQTAIFPTALHIRRCGFEYEGREFAVEVEDIHFNHGEYTAVIGESGGGKSTFIKILAGLIYPTEWAANFDLASFAASTAYVDQDAFLFKSSVKDNLTYGLATQPRPDVFKNVCRNILPDIDLDVEFSNVHKNLSGGQQQRIAIARALLLGRRVCLFDEALAALDTKQVEGIFAFCRAFDPHLTLVAVTHREEQLAFFDRTLRFEKGRCREES